jgi:hypothetical protein
VTPSARTIAAAVVMAGALALAGGGGEAHKPITSPYTFNDDVVPIMRTHCGRCHVTDGVAPMSLMTHAEAVPWGESIRAELLAGHMPPWRVDDAPARFRNVRPLTARELNVLMTWVTGGTPIGSVEKTPPPFQVDRAWPLGAPDLALPAPSEFALAADQQQAVAEFTLKTGTSEPRWVRAVDLLPGTPAIVRSATVSLKGAAQTAKAQADGPLETLLAVWVAEDPPVFPERDAAFLLPAGAELAVRVLYRKTWQYERAKMSDRSTVGLYFAPAPAAAIQALTLAPDSSAASGSTQPASDTGRTMSTPLSFSRTIKEDLRALAIYPDPALSNATVTVHAVRPNGSREPLINFHPRDGWARRYWFVEPIALPRGTRIEVRVVLDDPAALLAPVAAPPPPQRHDPSAVRLTLNVVAGT